MSGNNKDLAGYESFKEGDVRCKVYTPDGLFCQVEVRAKIPLAPEEVYAILTDPDNRKVFKNIKAVKRRHVLAEYGHRQLVEVEQEGRFKFMFINGTFLVHTLVDQDSSNMRMKFMQPKQGFMKAFDGEWDVRPFTREALEELNGELDPKNGTQMEFPLFEECRRLYASLEELLKQGKGGEWKPVTAPPEGVSVAPHARPGPSHSASSGTGPASPGRDGLHREADGFLQPYSLVILRQRVQPMINPPPGLAFFVRKVVSGVIQNMMKDLISRAKEINAERRAAAAASMAAHQLSDLDLEEEEEKDGEARPGPVPVPSEVAAAAAAVPATGEEAAARRSSSDGPDISWRVDGTMSLEGHDLEEMTRALVNAVEKGGGVSAALGVGAAGTSAAGEEAERSGPQATWENDVVPGPEPLISSLRRTSGGSEVEVWAAREEGPEPE